MPMTNRGYRRTLIRSPCYCRSGGRCVSRCIDPRSSIHTIAKAVSARCRAMQRERVQNRLTVKAQYTRSLVRRFSACQVMVLGRSVAQWEIDVGGKLGVGHRPRFADILLPHPAVARPIGVRLDCPAFAKPGIDLPVRRSNRVVGTAVNETEGAPTVERPNHDAWRRLRYLGSGEDRKGEGEGCRGAPVRIDGPGWTGGCQAGVR